MGVVLSSQRAWLLSLFDNSVDVLVKSFNFDTGKKSLH